MERIGEEEKSRYQPVEERTDLENMSEAPVMQKDLLRSGGYSRIRELHQRNSLIISGSVLDVPLPLPVSYLIRIGKEEGVSSQIIGVRSFVWCRAGGR